MFATEQTIQKPPDSDKTVFNTNVFDPIQYPAESHALAILLLVPGAKVTIETEQFIKIYEAE